MNKFVIQHLKRIMDIVVIDQRYRHIVQNGYNSVFQLRHIISKATSIMSRSIQQQLQGVINTRKLICLRKCKDYTSFITQNLLPKRWKQRLVSFSRKYQYPQLVFESVCALAFGQCQIVHKLDDKLIRHNDFVVAQRAMQCLGLFTDKNGRIIRNGALVILTELLERTMRDENSFKSLTNLFFDLCKRKISNVSVCHQILCLLTSSEKRMFYYQLSSKDWLLAVQNHCNTKQQIQAMFENGMMEFILSNLYSKQQKVVFGSLLIIEKIVRKNKGFIARLINLHLIKDIERLPNNLKSGRSIMVTLAAIFSQIILSTDFTSKKRLANSEIAMQLLSVVLQDCFFAFKDKLKVVTGVAPYVDSSDLFQILQQKNPKLISYLCGYIKRYLSLDLIQDLIILISIGESFKQNGKNLLAQKLLDRWVIVKLQRQMCKSNQQLTNYISILFQRFL